MQLALIRQWQTAALLLLVLGIMLAPLGLTGALFPALPAVWLTLVAPCVASAASMRLGYHRIAALCGAAGACIGAVLFWWVLSTAALAMITAGLTTATLASGALATLLVCLTATISDATGLLWQLPDISRRRALPIRSAALLANGSELPR
jgi:hypothetical protein